MSFGIRDGDAARAMPNFSPGEPKSTLGESQYARSRRELLSLLAELHGTGIQQELHLPQIAVVGSQSVGKSSLIEAISGIKLPRDSGTCTRCPMECRLEYTPNEWSCTVSLRLRGMDGRQQDFTFGEPLTSPEEVEQHLRRAQRALLRPGLVRSAFLDDSDLDTPFPSTSPPKSFTDDCVCVHIRGPDVTDLHFYDLPGIIVNVQQGQDESDIELVQSMVKEYISRQGCIVLLVVSCETDFENQSAGRLVRELDPTGENTVGVLTKPDRTDAESAQDWQRVNDKHQLESGWFVTKLPDSTELRQGVAASESRERSTAFFKTNQHWHGYALRNPGRIGTENLTEYLAERLSAQLRTDLPRIQNAVNAALANINECLAELPPASTEDPVAEVHNRVTQLAQEVSRRIQGNSSLQLDSAGLVQRLLVSYSAFKDTIWRTVPIFDATVNLVKLEDSESEAEPAKLIKDFGPDGEDAMVEVAASQIVKLSEVMKTAKDARTRELPGNCPFAVKKHYISQAIAQWQHPTEECFNNAYRILLQEMDKLVEERFAVYSHGGLLARVRSAVHAHLQRCSDEAAAGLRLELRKETNGPFTQNEHHLFQYKDTFLAHYKTASSPPVPNPIQPTQRRTDLGATAAVLALRNLGGAFANIDEKDLTKFVAPSSLPSDETATALDIMAEVRAYFQVAYKRYIDAVPLTIESALVREFEQTLSSALVGSTGLKLFEDGARASCEKWVAEPPAVAVRRRELESQRGALEEAKALLLDFE